jgi:chromosome segregation ATPase
MSEVNAEAATVEATEVNTDPVENEPVEGEAELGDAGKKALDAMKTERNTARSEVRSLKAEIAQLRAEVANKEKPAEEVALENARAEARAEAKSKADERILKSELKALATGKLEYPEDAHMYINLSDFEVDDDGNVDSDSLNDAIADLLKTRPRLAAGEKPRFEGGGDGGARAEAKKADDIDEQIAAAQQARNFPLVATLKQLKAAKKG